MTFRQYALRGFGPLLLPWVAVAFGGAMLVASSLALDALTDWRTTSETLLTAFVAVAAVPYGLHVSWRLWKRATTPRQRLLVVYATWLAAASFYAFLLLSAVSGMSMSCADGGNCRSSLSGALPFLAFFVALAHIVIIPMTLSFAKCDSAQATPSWPPGRDL